MDDGEWNVLLVVQERFKAKIETHALSLSTFYTFAPCLMPFLDIRFARLPSNPLH